MRFSPIKLTTRTPNEQLMGHTAFIKRIQKYIGIGVELPKTPLRASETRTKTLNVPLHNGRNENTQQDIARYSQIDAKKRCKCTKQPPTPTKRIQLRRLTRLTLTNRTKRLV